MSAFPPGWARVELMGHVNYVGYLEEIEAFGAKMGKINALDYDGNLTEHIFGGASVYQITPMTEESVREARTRWSPPALAQPAYGVTPEYNPFADDEDDLAGCHVTHLIAPELGVAITTTEPSKDDEAEEGRTNGH